MPQHAEQVGSDERRPEPSSSRRPPVQLQRSRTAALPQPRSAADGAARVALLSQPVAAAPASANGLPPKLRAGVEALSGLAMDDVRVHRNSSEPAKLGALAFARGTDIHLAPGQDQHLPHEAWHVVQQKQGRVRATAQMKAASLNDDATLEAEATEMGFKAGHETTHLTRPPLLSAKIAAPSVQLQSGPVPRDQERLWTANEFVEALIRLRWSAPRDKFVRTLEQAARFLPFSMRLHFNQCGPSDQEVLEVFDRLVRNHPLTSVMIAEDLAKPKRFEVRQYPVMSESPYRPGDVIRTESHYQEFQRKMGSMLDNPVGTVLAAPVLIVHGQERADKFIEQTAPVGGLIEAAGGIARVRSQSSPRKFGRPPPRPSRRSVPNTAPKRIRHPFEGVPPALRATVKKLTDRLSAQVGERISADRALIAPWVVGSSRATSAGWKRDFRTFLSKFRTEFPADGKLIGPGNTVTRALAKSMGWSSRMIGQKLEHHHIDNGPVVVLLPAGLHPKGQGGIHAVATVVGEP